MRGIRGRRPRSESNRSKSPRPRRRGTKDQSELTPPTSDVERTKLLAQSSRPPMGAKMMPTAKKSGSTVFGVKIGLQCRCQLHPDRPSTHRGMHHVLPCLQSLLPKRRVYGAEKRDLVSGNGNARQRVSNVLAGRRLLFFFLSSSRWPSWDRIESGLGAPAASGDDMAAEEAAWPSCVDGWEARRSAGSETMRRLPRGDARRRRRSRWVRCSGFGEVAGERGLHYCRSGDIWDAELRRM